MGSAWFFPSIAGGLQAANAAMNDALDESLANPWLATTISFLLVLFIAAALYVCMD